MDMDFKGCETLAAIETEADLVIEAEVDNLIDRHADDMAASLDMNVDSIIKVLEAFKPVLMRQVIAPATGIICEAAAELTEANVYDEAQDNVRSDIDLPLEGVAFDDMQTAIALLSRGDTAGGMVYLNRALSGCWAVSPDRRHYIMFDTSTGTLI